MNAKLIQLRLPSEERPILTEFYFKARAGSGADAYASALAWDMFQYVADITCRDLEDAFYLSNNPDGRDLSRWFKPVGKHRPYSMQVGDLLLTNHEESYPGKLYRCASIGFDEITDKDVIQAIINVVQREELQDA